jgi:hypothetical protein
MLASLIEGIYEVSILDGFMRHDIRTKFHENWFKHLSNFTVITAKI